MTYEHFLRGGAFIGGQWGQADDGGEFAVQNPATGEDVARVANCGREETARAVEAAVRAQREWSAWPVKKRAAVLRAWHDLIMTNQEALARLLTAEQGKPLPEARGEIAYGASYIEWFAEEAKRINGDVIPAPAGDKRVICLKQPVGVVACITPWNFPNAMLARKIAPALAAGCAVVCKPANETPLSALALAALAEDAGVPSGVINVLCGKTQEIGQELTSSKLVRKLTFTGSTAVGKKLMADCAGTVKRMSMELGGNAPFIVFDDADIDQAVKGLIASKFRNAGQTCVCANRILVQEGVYEAFSEKLVSAVKALKVGDGMAEGVELGPLISDKAVHKVSGLIEDACKKGANVLYQGAAPGACFVSPTVLGGVTRDMRVFTDEIFGPVAPLFKFTSDEEAIRIANDTDYGLASYVYTRDMTRIWRISEKLEYGMVGVNEGIISNEAAPFGGVKESGFGREGSKYGLDDYLELKYICIGGIGE